MNELRRMEFQLDNAVFYQLTWDIKKKKTKILGRCRSLYFIYKRCFISSFLHFVLFNQYGDHQWINKTKSYKLLIELSVLHRGSISVSLKEKITPLINMGEPQTQEAKREKRELEEQEQNTNRTWERRRERVFYR